MISRLMAFDLDLSDQSNITFELLESDWSNLFDLDRQGLLTIRELPLKLPSMIELDLALRDTFVVDPCRKEEKLIVLIGELSSERDALIDQYEKQLANSQEHRLMTQKLATNKRKKQETLLIFFAFSLSTLIICLGIVSLLIVVCCRTKTNNNEQRRTLTPAIDESPHSFITDSNGKSSLLRSLR